MFNADTKNQQRSGEPLGNGWQFANRSARAGQHTTAEGVSAKHSLANRGRPLMTPVGGGGGGWNWRGLYNASITYALNDCVQLASGTSAGLYLCTQSSNTNPPDSGIGWVTLSSYATWL